ncbi:hypothetical protein [Nocardioides sediminis]|uniref:hypothetical protein n=1 Tax=Nocardioides sediminis TaxID=433648 RepID=UPI00131F46DE|nr:hypothetical protein [Nocardioides sediminis]
MTVLLCTASVGASLPLFWDEHQATVVVWARTVALVVGVAGLVSGLLAWIFVRRLLGLNRFLTRDEGILEEAREAAFRDYENWRTEQENWHAANRLWNVERRLIEQWHDQHD